MTAKEFLNRGRDIEKEIEQLRRLKHRAYNQATSATTTADKQPVSGGMGRDVFASYAQYTAALEEQTAELLDIQREIRAAIEKVKKARYRQLLTARYIEGMTWEQVAVEMNYSYSQIVKYLHPRALEAIREIMP